MTRIVRQRARLGIAVALVGMAGLGVGACGSTPSATPPAAHVRGVTVAVPPTTSTTLADCGAKRDPLDPTNTPPPAGSPAICP
jgi:hypothetical protein